MKRKIPGLASAARPEAEEIPDGLYLVQVARVQYRWEKQKPVYLLQLEIIAPEALAGRTISGRLYATVKALWKLSWFLRDFGYDPDLLGREELDERALVGLRGVVKLTHSNWNGRSFQNLEAFAPAANWAQLEDDNYISEEVDQGSQRLPGFDSEVA